MKTTDNTRLDLGEVKLSEGFISKIANKELKDLESEQLFLFPPYIIDIDDLSSDQKILESSSDYVRTTNIMGVIGYNDEQLFIGSRFDVANDYFFYYMLKKVLNINIISNEVNMEAKNSYLDLLILLFPKYLNTAMRKGLFKEYKVHHYNDLNIKGKPEFKRHVKENTPFTGKVAYSTREFSYDNQVINLIRYTIEFIKRRKDFRKILNIDDVMRENVKVIEANSNNYQKPSTVNVIQYNLKKPVRHGYYHEYRALQLLCLAILRADRSVYKKQERNRVNGILFDGAWLFEEYVNLLIQDEYFHPQNKQNKGQQYLFDGSIGLIYPDFISKNSVNRSVADAKYKRFGGIYGKDYLQLLAYMYRFEARQGYFIYPKNYDDVEKNARLSLLKDINSNAAKRGDDVTVVKVGIGIPYDSVSFKEFEERMAHEEKVFRNEIKMGKIL